MSVDQKLFNFMFEERGITLLDSEIHEIKLICTEEGRSEQLKAYAKLLQKKYVYHLFDEHIEESVNEFTSIQLARKSCHHACSPSDYYKGGKCDKMGCYGG